MPRIGKIFPNPDGKLQGRVRVWNKQTYDFQMVDHPQKGQGPNVPPFQLLDRDGFELGTGKWFTLPNTGEQVLKLFMDNMDWPESLFLTGYSAGNDSYDLDWQRPRKRTNAQGNQQSNQNNGQDVPPPGGPDDYYQNHDPRV